MKSDKDRDMYFDISQYFLKWIDERFTDLINRLKINDNLRRILSRRIKL